MAVSLPPELGYQDNKNGVLTPTNSSFASHEDLQCNWHELPKFDIEPVTGESSEFLASRPQSHSTVKKASSRTLDYDGEKQGPHLSSLFLHQVERKINQYKSLLGRRSSSRKNLSNVASFVSVKDAEVVDQAANLKDKEQTPNVSRQTSTKRTKDQEGNFNFLLN